MKKYLALLLSICGILLLNKNASAQDFIYEPKNPSFGGQTFNYQWMMSSAEAQNKIKDPDAKDPFSAGLGFEQDPIKDFAKNLNRQILNDISRRLVAQQFGEGGLQEGQFVLGDFQIDVSDSGSGISIVIVDLTNGNQTTVTVPTF